MARLIGAGGSQKIGLEGLFDFFFTVQHAGCRLTQDPGAAPKLSLSLGAAPEDLGQDLEKA